MTYTEPQRPSWTQQEPITMAVIITALTAVVASVIAALVAFNVPLTEEQQSAVLGLVAPVVTVVFIVTALLARRRTVPLVRVQAYETVSGATVAGEAFLDDSQGRWDPVTGEERDNDVPPGTPVIVAPLPNPDVQPVEDEGLA